MRTAARSILVIALASGAALLPSPFSVACTVAWLVLSLWAILAYQNALCRVSQGVVDRTDQELGDLIEASRRVPVSTK
jgi:hypothetical protein